MVKGSGHGKSKPPYTRGHLKRLISGMLQPTPGIGQATVLFVNAFQSHRTSLVTGGSLRVEAHAVYQALPLGLLTAPSPRCDTARNR